MRHARTLEFVCALSITVFVVVTGMDSVSTRPETGGSRYHLTMSYNLFQYGVLSAGREDLPDPDPGFRREPLYPSFVAGLMALLADRDEVSHHCLTLPEPRCEPLLQKLKFANVALLVALCWATFWAGRILTRHRWPGVLAMLIVATSGPWFIVIDRFKTELPGALLLLLASTLLCLGVGSNGRLWHRVLAGLALGALILTKAVFFYVGPVLLGVGLLLGLAPEHRRLGLRIGTTVLVAYLVAGVWVARNVQLGAGPIISQDRTVLAIRAEYTTMTWQEYWASWFYFVRREARGRVVLERFFEPSDYERLSRDNPNGFYRRAKKRTGAVAERTGVANPSSEQMQSAAASLIRENLGMQLALTGPFAVRGMYIHKRVFNWGRIGHLLEWTANLLIPSLIVAGALLLARRDMTRLMFFMPALYNFALHATATHNIPRYSWSLIACGAVAFVTLLSLLLDAVEVRVFGPDAPSRARSGAPAPAEPAPVSP